MSILIQRFAVLLLILSFLFGGMFYTDTAMGQAAWVDTGSTDQQQDIPDAGGNAPWLEGETYSLEDALRLEPMGVDASTDVGLTSDTFNSCTLDTGVWSLTDPPGAATMESTGTHLKVTVPSGVDYNSWKGIDNFARVTQDVSNDNFQVVVKFDSDLTDIVTGQYKIQGIIIEGQTTESGDPDPIKEELLRFEFHSRRADMTVGALKLVAYGAWVRPDNNQAQTALEEEITPIPAGSTLYMRITRDTVEIEGRLRVRWTMEYSVDGTTWNKVNAAGADPNADFIRDLNTQKAGIYVGSTASAVDNTPGHTAEFDYFWAAEDPITVDPEDDTMGLTVTTDTVGNGDVAVDPPSGPYACGDDVTFEATPEEGWSFVEWSGDLSGSANPVTVPFDIGLNAIANFSENQATQYGLTVTVNGSGAVTSAPAGINCGATCSADYDEGTEVTLSATADAGSTFTGWSGAVNSDNASVTVTMDAAKSVVATFIEEASGNTLSVQVFPANGDGGKVTSSPAGIDCGADCSHAYDADTEVVLTAASNPGYNFAGWTGAASGSDAQTTLTMDGNKTVIATFEEKQYTLTASANDANATVNVEPQKTTYSYGDEVTLTLSTTENFVGWTGDATGTDNPLAITIGVDTAENDTEIVITADFESTEPVENELYLPIVKK